MVRKNKTPVTLSKYLKYIDINDTDETDREEVEDYINEQDYMPSEEEFIKALDERR